MPDMPGGYHPSLDRLHSHAIRMSEVPPAGLRRPAFHALAASIALAFAGCAEPTPAGADASLEASPATTAGPVLHCMPAALVSLRLPLSEGFALAHDGAETGERAVDCVLSQFGSGALKSPAAFDRAYGQVFAYHEEDGTLALPSIPRETVQLFRLGEAGDANTWLLRIDTGAGLEGSRYDVLFSTGKADGKLVDQLLVGAMGVLYRRDYDIDAADAFAIREDTGREASVGPGYRARYRVGPDGRFALVAGQVLPPSSSTPEAGHPSRPPSGTSLETLPGRFGEIAPIRALLFEDGEVEEKAIVRIDAGDTPVMLAIGVADAASFALYVLSEVPSSALGGNTLHRVGSLLLDPPAGAVSAELLGHRWRAGADGRVRIELALRHLVPRPGGDPGTGEPENIAVDATAVAIYDPDSGALALGRAD